MKFYLRTCTAFGTVLLTAMLLGLVFQVQFSISGGAMYALMAGSAVYGLLSAPRGSAAPQLPQATAVQLPLGDHATGGSNGIADATHRQS